MTRTVEEITDAAHLQMGRQLDLHMSLVDIGALVSAVAHSLEAGRRLGTAPIVLDVPDDVIVQGDHARLERVLENVIGNAVKYSPAGTPVLVAVHSDGEWATIAVRDSGVGIPAEELPHIFTHFYRASTAVGIRGTGLGLAGARTIVEQHGGRIAIESVVGQGTKVIVSLPRSLSSNETSAAR